MSNHIYCPFCHGQLPMIQRGDAHPRCEARLAAEREQEEKSGTDS